VLLLTGSVVLLEGGHNTLRIVYSSVTPDQIDEGVSRLAVAVRAIEAGARA